jgi:dihydropteroate synthase
MHWQTSRYQIDLTRPKVMGIVNVTPDSFSDGGLHATVGAARVHCDKLLKDGAHVLDIGGESTRPGAVALSLDEELARVLPVVQYAVTYKPQVMQAVLDLGADIINDVWALRWCDTAASLAGASVVAAHPSCGICLMHMHREPQTMQARPMQGDVVVQVHFFLEQHARALQALGVSSARICIDPGIGFGKTVQQNFTLLAFQRDLVALGYPVLGGWSRKSSLAAVTQTSLSTVVTLDVHDRMAPSVVAAVLAVQRGARVVRVHDVKETVQALNVLAALQAAELAQ